MPAKHNKVEIAQHPLNRPTTVRDWVRGFTLHALTGILAVAAHYSVMWLLLKWGDTPFIASGTGFATGAVTRYLLSYYKVFAPSESVPVTMAKFVVALAAQMFANLLLLDLLTKTGLDLWSAQIGTTIMLTFTNYLVYRLWVFK